MPKRTPNSPPPPPTAETSKSPERPFEFDFLRSRIVQGIEKMMKEKGANNTDKLLHPLDVDYFIGNITHTAKERGFYFASEEENEEALKFGDELEALTGLERANAAWSTFLAEAMYIGDKKGEDLLAIGSKFNTTRFWYGFLSRDGVMEKIGIDSMSNDEIAELGHKMFSEYVKGRTTSEETYQKQHAFLTGHQSHNIWYPLRKHFKFEGMKPEEIFSFGEKYQNPYIWEAALKAIGKDYFRQLDSRKRGELRDRVAKSANLYGKLLPYLEQYFNSSNDEYFHVSGE